MGCSTGIGWRLHAVVYTAALMGINDLPQRAVSAPMKTSLILILSLLAFPLSAEVRGAVRGGVFAGTNHDAVATIELDARHGDWSIAPAFDSIRGGYGLHAVHIDVRHLFHSAHNIFWIGAGPTFVSTNDSSKTTWNADAGLAWRTKSAWEPFIAARYYSFRMPVFRDVVEGSGPVISIGVSRRFR
jgi:hypothetical protein